MTNIIEKGTGIDYLGKPNEEELVIGQVDSRKSLFISISLDP